MEPGHVHGRYDTHRGSVAADAVESKIDSPIVLDHLHVAMNRCGTTMAQLKCRSSSFAPME